MRILGYHRIADGRRLAVGLARALPRADARGGRERREADPPRSRARAAARGPVTGRYVCVTFDDGYRDNLLAAAPVLAELDIPATIFVPSRIIDGDAAFHWYEDPPPALSWDEVGELVAGGLVDVQSHTLTHPLLPQVDAERSHEEIAGSKRAIEAHVPYVAHELLLPGRALRRARGRVRARGGLRGGGDDEPRRQQRRRRSARSCAARSSTAPTTCATFRAKLDGAARRRDACCGARCTRAARAPRERPPSRRALLLGWKEWARTRARDERRLNMRMPTEPTPTTPAPRAGVAVRPVAARAAY